MSQLERIEKVTAIDVFTGGQALPLIEGIEKEVRSFVPDTSTAKTRKEIASLSAKVSKSKVLLDNLGKDLVSDWKNQAKVVDGERKLVRDRLDALRDEVRQPLTEWEESEKARIEAERVAKQIAEDYEIALPLNELFDLKRENERKEEEHRIAEQARIEKEQAEKAEADRIEREKQIAIDAAENARIEAEQKAAKEKEEAEQKVIEAKAAVELEKQKAIQAAEQAEKDKQQAIKDAEEKARIEAEEVERLRIVEEEKERAEKARLKMIEDKKAANKRHQASVNNAVLKKLIALGLDEKTGKTLISAIARNEVPKLVIQY